MTAPVYWLTKGRHRLVAFDADDAVWTTACGLTVADSEDITDRAPHPACGRCMGSDAQRALAAARRPKSIGSKP